MVRRIRPNSPRASSIVADLCEAEELRPHHGKKIMVCSKYQCKATFCCGNRTCSNTWTSHIVWMKFDLSKRCVSYVWKQKCSKCTMPAIPYLAEDDLQFLCNIAIKKCLLQLSDFEPRSPVALSDSDADLQHKCELCEMCLQRKCNCITGKPFEEAGRNVPEATIRSKEYPSVPGFIDQKYGSWDRALDETRLDRDQRDLYVRIIHKLRNICDETLETFHSLVEGGSFAKGTDWTKSDLDLVVFIKGKFDQNSKRAAMLKVHNELEKKEEWTSKLNNFSIQLKYNGGDNSCAEIDLLFGGLVNGVTHTPATPMFFLKLKNCVKERQLWNPSGCIMKKQFFVALFKRDYGRDVLFCFQGAVRLLKLWADSSDLKGRKSKVKSCLLELLLMYVVRTSDCRDKVITMNAPLMFGACLDFICRETTFSVALPFNASIPPIKVLEECKKEAAERELKASRGRGRGRGKGRGNVPEVVMCPCNPRENYASTLHNPYKIPFEELRKAAKSTLDEMHSGQRGS